MDAQTIENETVYGPAMQALTPKQRNYVLAMLSDPFGNPTRWARAAGYSDKSEAAKVSGHRLAHDPAIEEAVNEVARKHLHAMGPILGVAVAVRIAKDPKHPKQLRAAEMLMNRVGMHETTEHRVTVNHTGGAEAMIARIEEMAVRLGLDPAKLLGANAAPMKVIEHEEKADAVAERS